MMNIFRECSELNQSTNKEPYNPLLFRVAGVRISDGARRTSDGVHADYVIVTSRGLVETYGQAGQ
jgi:hypothetical protein